MKDFFVMYARDARRANQTVLGLVGGLPLAVRNQPGRTYYGSLHRLTAHILDANITGARSPRSSMRSALKTIFQASTFNS
jgi:hypothetical protein